MRSATAADVADSRLIPPGDDVTPYAESSPISRPILRSVRPSVRVSPQPALFY